MTLNRRHLLTGVAAAARAADPFPLWSGGPMPAAKDLAPVEGARFHVIKAHEPERDGYRFLHGVALAWHKDALYASYGHNKGIENTAGEEARGRVSHDGGGAWNEDFQIARAEGDLSVSHGVFLSHAGRLWAFQGAFHGARQRVHMRAYLLDEQRHEWTFRGVAAEDGFWPMQEPVRLRDGHWAMAGFLALGPTNGENPAAVAISNGDFARWEVVRIPLSPGLGSVWGESAVMVAGHRLINVARWGAQSTALAAESRDSGRNWTPSAPSNLPMATSKPYMGTLSNGVSYLIGTTTSDSGRRRSPLTIALTRPRETAFHRIYRIRDAVCPPCGGDSHERASLSYPYAVERRGSLYVAYSNNGGRTGMNLNSAELAILPLRSLR
ncbi:MAG: exo-alpha-sialidase [Bryobacteraceae bacterium]